MSTIAQADNQTNIDQAIQACEFYARNYNVLKRYGLLRAEWLSSSDYYASKEYQYIELLEELKPIKHAGIENVGYNPGMQVTDLLKIAYAIRHPKLKFDDWIKDDVPRADILNAIRYFKENLENAETDQRDQQALLHCDALLKQRVYHVGYNRTVALASSQEQRKKLLRNIDRQKAEIEAAIPPTNIEAAIALMEIYTDWSRRSLLNSLKASEVENTKSKECSYTLRIQSDQLFFQNSEANLNKLKKLQQNGLTDIGFSFQSLGSYSHELVDRKLSEIEANNLSPDTAPSAPHKNPRSIVPTNCNL